MIDINELKFDEKGLIPAVVQDSVSKEVLTVAYMSRESLLISMEKGLTCFWSRSRQELWLKGATSGNYQHIVSIIADCDKDALTVLVEPDGPACHLGTRSCFNGHVWNSSELQDCSLQYLYDSMQSLNRDIAPAPKTKERDVLVSEIADLSHTALTKMIRYGITPKEILYRLRSMMRK